MEGMTAMILGAGNVTRAIAWGLRQRHAEVVISSRTYDRAQLLAAEIGCRAVEWELRHEPRIQLLVNGTPVGMHPDVDNSPYDASKLNEYLAVFDTVLQSGKHAADQERQASPVPDRNRCRHVCPPSGLSIQIVHGTGSADRPRCGRRSRCDQSGATELSELHRRDRPAAAATSGDHHSPGATQ